MKRRITASVSDPVEELLDLLNAITKCQDLCGYLEDCYWGEPVVDKFSACFKNLESAQRNASKALSELTS